jgi:hypothetical protein
MAFASLVTGVEKPPYLSYLSKSYICMNNVLYMTDPFEAQKNRQAALITLGVAGLLLLILFIVKLTFPENPIPQFDDVVEVNLGSSDNGFGTDQPLLPGEPAQAQQVAYVPPAPTHSNEETVKQVETDDKNPDAPEIKNPVTAKPNATKVNEINKTIKTNNKPQPVISTAPPKPKAVLGHTTGGNGNGGNGADSYKPGGNEGNGTGNGDKGVPGGDPNGKSYTGTPKNFGIMAFSIPNQSFQDDFDRNAKIAMDIETDENGKVISATYQPRGSTGTATPRMREIARTYALTKLKMGSTMGRSKGTVVFNFQVK